MSKLLSIENIRWRAGGKEILRGVSFEMDLHQFVTVIGPNGAGKSTLIKQIAGVIPIQEGDIQLRGKSIRELEGRERARIVAYVPQNREPDIPFTPRQLVEQARYPYLGAFGKLDKSDRRLVEQAIALTRSESFVDQPFATLSGGEQQKVLIAAAIAQDAPLILLDEPTTFLDPAVQDEVYELLRQIRAERRVSILVVTHDLNRAILSTDRMIALRAGEIIRSGPPAEIAREDVLREVFGSEFLTIDHPTSGHPMILPRGES